MKDVKRRKTIIPGLAKKKSCKENLSVALHTGIIGFISTRAHLLKRYIKLLN